MSKSSTIPETMHTSLTSAYDLRTNRYGFQRHLHEISRLQAESIDGNGNTPLLSITTIGEQQVAKFFVDSLPSIELHSLSTFGMAYSSASDSGCMIESGSTSTATADDDDEQTVRSLFQFY
ncbi:unnamed protein product [Brugia timori]|uniref:Uncharacterized protein n=1 Tax=Brugia timori TaxID=42155 RepID=A0A0R3R7F5_9BILA|nr:unnamed protein product [Brugia timori]